MGARALLGMIGAMILCALCVACGNESTTSPTGSTTSLAGTDANSDGVRDDIESYIDTTYPVPANLDTNKALRQYAKAAQSSIIDASDAGKSVTHSTERFRALECLMSRRPTDFHPLFVELRARILDTLPRSEAYLNADSHAATVNIPLFPADQWAGACA
ncbi:MAG: hypothetical protein E8D49_00050 [Nitrospira sp.]|jgi:hypothetical protein|nr:MAG: hypothetical protein E8D49_00050 [Nitrospira sp.]